MNPVQPIFLKTLSSATPPSKRAGFLRPLPPLTRGYTLIEVLVAITLIGFGLLGTGFLIALGLQNVQASNHLTVATDLTQQGLDMMKANRIEAYRMLGQQSSRAVACGVGDTTNLTPFQQRRVWDCRMHQQLPDPRATWTLNNGMATITLSWSGSRGDNSADNRRELTMEIQL